MKNFKRCLEYVVLGSVIALAYCFVAARNSNQPGRDENRYATLESQLRIDANKSMDDANAHLGDDHAFYTYLDAYKTKNAEADRYMKLSDDQMERRLAGQRNLVIIICILALAFLSSLIGLLIIKLLPAPSPSPLSPG